MSLSAREKQTHIRNRQVVAKEWGGRGMDWEFGVSKCKRLYIGWTSNKVLMCRPGGQSQYPVMNCSGKECTNMYKVCELLRRVRLCNPAGCSSLGSSVHGILQARTRVGSHALLQGIFPTQGSNLPLLRLRQILYSLSHQRSPNLRM